LERLGLSSKNDGLRHTTSLRGRRRPPPSDDQPRSQQLDERLDPTEPRWPTAAEIIVVPIDRQPREGKGDVATTGQQRGLSSRAVPTVIGMSPARH
jgi:hypothetical protein